MLKRQSKKKTGRGRSRRGLRQKEPRRLGKVYREGDPLPPRRKAIPQGIGPPAGEDLSEPEETPLSVIRRANEAKTSGFNR
jgi:hypothetical protein